MSVFSEGFILFSLLLDESLTAHWAAAVARISREDCRESPEPEVALAKLRLLTRVFRSWRGFISTDAYGIELLALDFCWPVEIECIYKHVIENSAHS